jgi:hypothetical protein
VWYLELNNTNSGWLRRILLELACSKEIGMRKVVFERMADENSKEQHFFGLCKPPGLKISLNSGSWQLKTDNFNELCCHRYNYICKIDGMYKCPAPEKQDLYNLIYNTRTIAC